MCASILFILTRATVVLNCSPRCLHITCRVKGWKGRGFWNFLVKKCGCESTPSKLQNSITPKLPKSIETAKRKPSKSQPVWASSLRPRPRRQLSQAVARCGLPSRRMEGDGIFSLFKLFLVFWFCARWERNTRKEMSKREKAA